MCVPSPGLSLVPVACCCRHRPAPPRTPQSPPARAYIHTISILTVMVKTWPSTHPSTGVRATENLMYTTPLKPMNRSCHPTKCLLCMPVWVLRPISQWMHFQRCFLLCGPDRGRWAQWRRCAAVPPSPPPRPSPRPPLASAPPVAAVAVVVLVLLFPAPAPSSAAAAGHSTSAPPAPARYLRVSSAAGGVTWPPPHPH